MLSERVTSLRPTSPPTQTVMTALLELYYDSPVQFEQFARWVARGARPQYGSVTLSFRDGKAVTVEKKETRQ
jgi:hypothetical protein